ncbi:hypothetical protein BX600DRAFT_544420 [Xylariales sp. PMI_506]|nr:hypothetical protein BX600DRAFT_544420 [Xylariales sp. PMI_506]
MSGFQDSVDYRGWVEVDANSCLIAISTLIFCGRIYARAIFKKSLGLDDAIASVAYVLVVVQSSLDIAAVPEGSGAHLNLLDKSQILAFFKILAILQLVYFWAVAMVRFAIMAFIPRICKDGLVIKTLYVLAFINLVNTLVSFIFRLAECTPVSDNFLPPTFPGVHCVSTEVHKNMNRAHAFIGLFIDTGLLVLPIWVVYNKMLFSKKTVKVLCVFSFGIFAVVTGIVRIYYMMTLDFTTDITYKMSFNGIWTDLESHIGFWCSCFPAFSSILRIVSYKLGLRSELKSQRSGANPGSYAVQGSQRRWQSIKDAADNDNDSQRAIVAANHELQDIQHGGIRKQMNFSVSTNSGKAEST